MRLKYRMEVNAYKGTQRTGGGSIILRADSEEDSRQARNAAFQAARVYAEEKGWLNGSTGAGFGIREVIREEA